MDGVKVINISSSNTKPKKKLTKKQMYKEILSSSDKIKEIISNRKKTKRFDYLNTIPQISNNNLPNNNLPNNNLPNKNISHKNKNTSCKKISDISSKENSNKTKTKPNIKNTKQKQNKINDYFQVHKKPEQSKIKINTQESQTNQKQNQDQVKQNHQLNLIKPQENLKPSNPPKKVSFNENIVTQIKYRPLSNHKVIYQPKKFTDTQIKEFLLILIKLNNLEQFSKIHKSIRRINKIQTNQLLFALRLITKYSNAPENMLKNTLFNFITGSIKISR